MLKVYNIQRGLPLTKLPSGKHLLNYTPHARREAIAKMAKHNLTKKIELPSVIDFNNADIVEIEAEKGIIQKVLCRFPYDDLFDIVLPILLLPEGKLAKTVWLNSKTDDHPTLDISKYADPSEFELDVE